MKWMRPFCCSVVLFAATTALTPNHARAMSEVFDQSKKDELKLKYQVSVTDLGNGRVFVTFTIADEGRLEPIRSVDLEIPGRDKDKDGWVAPELHLSLAVRKTDAGAKIQGKQTDFEITKDLADRAEIWLTADQLDGKREPLTGYAHSIPIAPYLKSAQKTGANPADRRAGSPAAPTPPASERKN